MGKNDYQKSYSRQMETIVVVISAIYSFTELALGYMNSWNQWGLLAVLCSLLVTWIFYFGKYHAYEVRAYVVSGLSQVGIFVYAVEIGDFYSVISVFISLCILLGMYGIPKAMLFPTINYTMILGYYIFIDKSLVWGSYSSDIGMLTRIFQGYLVLFAVFYLVYRYKVTQDSMLEMIDALKKSEREKDDFLANVSHEIRTPINTICGISEIMLKEDIPQEVQDDIVSIQSAGRNLMSVVGDILDYSELQEGNFELVEENYYVSSTVYDIINMTMAKKSEKPIELIVNCDSSMPSMLTGDEQKIRRVIMNLVNNAIEFTSEGCVCIDFRHRMEEYGINLIITVKDTGIGMSKESIEKLFRKFSQADMGRTRKKGGVGLGLAIAQALVNKMGGFITVSSELGKGSEFRVVIPQKIYDEKPIADIPSKTLINAAVYVNMEQFSMPRIRDEYKENIRRMVTEIGVKCRVCRNLQELKRWEEREAYTQVFITLVEYMEDPAFFDSLSMRTRVYMIIDSFNASKVQNKLISKIYKPFFVLSILAAIKNDFVNADELTYEDEEHQLYAPDVNILVIDDNRMNIRVVEGLLKEYGVNVSYALSGQEGINMLDSQQYDLVLLDHMMPEMDGVETLHNIRKKKSAYFKEIPILALTANAIAGTRELLIKEGFDDFLAKPVENSVLQRALKRHIPKEKQSVRTETVVKEESQSQVAESSDMTQAVAEKTDVFAIGDLDIEKGILYCGNKDNYIEILKSHRDSASDNRDQIQGLYEKEDWKNYTIVVHGIKSSMMSIGAVTLSEMAKALELAGKASDFEYIKKEHDAMLTEYDRVMKLLEESEYLGKKQADEGVCTKPAIAEEELSKRLEAMENAMYDLDSALMEQLLKEFFDYSYFGKDLEKELQPVCKKVEMLDLMSAYDSLVKLIDKMKKS